jgi:Zn-dependent protease/predicted transcriptional regulator
MFKGGIPIGKAFGISLRLHYSWFIVFVLVTWALVSGYFPASFPHWSLGISILAGVITSLLFFASVLVHELMHSIVSIKQGIPVESITLFIFGGVSQIAEEPKKPIDEFRMTLAGPLSSLILGLIFLAIWFWWADAPEMIKAISFWLGWINIFLAGFNLIPGFPLDGGRILRSLIWWRTGNLNKATKIASYIGQGVGYLFILAGLFFIFTGNWFNGFWLALIGWFLQSAAKGSYQQLALGEILKGHTAIEIMSRECFVISPALSIEQMVSEHILGQGRRCLMVSENDKVIGLLTLQDIKKVSRDRWASTSAREVMVPLHRLKVVSPETELSTVLKIIISENVNQIPVMENGVVIGMIGRDNLLSFINIRSELGKSKH